MIAVDTDAKRTSPSVHTRTVAANANADEANAVNPNPAPTTATPAARTRLWSRRPSHVPVSGCTSRGTGTPRCARHAWR
jgi:hypothetical protein